MALVAASGGETYHRLANESTTRIAFKIKTTNKVDYRLRPVYGFISPGCTQSLTIRRCDGAPGEDELVIQFKEASLEVNDAAAFMREVTPDGEVIVPISAK